MREFMKFKNFGEKPYSTIPNICDVSMGKPILDVACGSKMFYWNKNDPRVHFNDIRKEEKELCDGRKMIVSPDSNWDFTNLPVPDNTYNMVVFDPPHLLHAGEESWLKAKYGTLPKNWKEFIKQGFDECMRVLKPNGTLVMKWSCNQISGSEILKAIETKPILGTRRSKKNYWWIFMKGERE